MTAQTNAVTPVRQTERGGLLIGLALLVALTLLVAELDGALAAFFRGQGVAQNLLEYPLTAVLVGLAANFVLRSLKLHAWLKPAMRTELFLKIGLVLLGARISLRDLLATGAGGLIQALVLVTAVFFFTWWLAGRFNLPPTLKAVMASAVSICGVSAAIAAAGAVQARREEVTYISTLVILTALPLMVLMPFLAGAMGLPPQVAGAWFGGNIDTTAAVVGAGTLYGPEAQQVAAVVKLAQNVLIGFVAFALALYFALRVERDSGQRPSPRMIWERFPKFVLGFALVSLLATAGALTPPLVRELNTATQWMFALAFVCIGLDFSLTSLREAGWKPVLVYLSATVFNTLVALAAAWVIFGLAGVAAG
ncbi:MAG: putative sulfate exporter family transporter [Anaerolineae bacterium]|nr:putative sulfate exporter family transporter [Anaerolineae bacterium]